MPPTGMQGISAGGRLRSRSETKQVIALQNGEKLYVLKDGLMGTKASSEM